VTGRIPLRLVRLVAGTLPSGLRDRYREQWLADVRDGAAAGVSVSSIVLASLVFAATVDRASTPTARRVPTAAVAARRSRHAVALAVGGVIVTATATTGATRGGSLSANGGADFVRFFAIALLEGYSVLAPAAAVVLIVATRGMRARVRLAVVLLAASVVLMRWGWVVENSAQAGGLGQWLTYGAAVTLCAGALALLVGCVWPTVGRAKAGRAAARRAAAGDRVGHATVVILSLAAVSTVGVANLLAWLPADVIAAASGVTAAVRPGAPGMLLALTFGWLIGVAVLAAVVIVVPQSTGRTPRSAAVALIGVAVATNGIVAAQFARGGWSASVPATIGLLILLGVMHREASRRPAGDSERLVATAPGVLEH
jgi:hypothetical protein